MPIYKSMNKISHDCVDCIDFIIMLAGSLCIHLLRFEFYCQSLTQTRHIHWNCVLIVVTLLINFTKLTCLETWEKTLFLSWNVFNQIPKEMFIVLWQFAQQTHTPMIIQEDLMLNAFRLRKWYFLNDGYCLKINWYTVVV